MPSDLGADVLRVNELWVGGVKVTVTGTELMTAADTTTARTLLSSSSMGHTHSAYALTVHDHNAAYAVADHSHAYAASNHTHDYSGAFAAVGHTHPYAATVHTHDYAATGHSHDYSATYAASGHTHTAAGVGAAAAAHTHAAADVTSGTLANARLARCIIPVVPATFANVAAVRTYLASLLTAMTNATTGYHTAQ